MEDRGLAFQALVAGGFRQYSKGRDQVVLVDGSRGPEVVAEEIWREVERGRR